jgi:NAD(P)-dependent dehydrogenase (short-subunit alcohol dehydrogenase family)
VPRLDLADPAEAAAVIDELAQALGALDVLVNNAGGGTAGPVLDIALEDLEQTLKINVVGSFACAEAAARRMVSAVTPGRIINVTSIHEHLPLPDAADYTAAKHALGGLTKAMALELAPTRSPSTPSHPARSPPR